MPADIPRELSAGGESGQLPKLCFKIFFQMSKKQVDTSQEMSDSNVQEILFAKKSSGKRSRKDSDTLATSSAQESGSDSLGEARIAKVL